MLQSGCSNAQNYFLSKNLTTVCASYDLNSAQLTDLLKNTESGKVEVTIHQYMPSFHMEHCVFAAFMSEGKSFRDCGKPCEEHRLELKDQFGNHHQIKADQECRNTMFNAVPQSAAKLIPKLIETGVREFRFEALYERGLIQGGKFDNAVVIVDSYLTNLSAYGVQITDLNGDGSVDGSDAVFYENNATNSVFSNHPLP